MSGHRRLATAVLAMVPALAGMSGCWGVPPMEQVGLVSLLAIDRSQADGVELTASIDMPTSASATPGLGQMAQALVRRAAGRTLQEAVGRLRTQSYLTIGFDHLEALLVSQSVARAGLATPLADMTTSPEFVTTPYLLVVRHGSAGAVLEALRSAKPRPEVVVTNTINQARVRTPYRPRRLYDFLQRAQLAGDGFVTSGVAVNAAQPGGATSPAFEVEGQAMFDRDRLAGWLGADSALGWALATGEAGHPTIELDDAHGGYGLEVLRDVRRVRIRGEPGPEGVAADLDIRVRARLSAAQAVPVDWWSDPDAVTRLARATAVRVAMDVLAALAEAQADRADVFSLGEYVRVQDPGAWARLGARWDGVGFPHLPVRVRVHVAIAHLGTLVCPPFAPCRPPASPL